MRHGRPNMEYDDDDPIAARLEQLVLAHNALVENFNAHVSIVNNREVLRYKQIDLCGFITAIHCFVTTLILLYLVYVTAEVSKLKN